MNTVEVPVKLLRDNVHVTSEAAAICQKIAADQTAVQTKAPQVVNYMIENGLVDAMDKEATIQLLSDHAATLDIVSRLVKQARSANETPRTMGTAVKESRSSHDPQFPPQKESDRVFEQMLRGGD